jgi:uncharacterized UPF0146 family protein
VVVDDVGPSGLVVDDVEQPDIVALVAESIAVYSIRCSSCVERAVGANG